MAKARRQQVAERAMGRCEYCRFPEELDVQPFQVDHVRAIKHSGPTTLANLAWSCLPCNAAKGPNVAGYDPEGGTLEPLYNPRADSWDDHFAWEGPVLKGKTAIGRTTIEVLKINAPDRVELRRLLIAAGLF
ncbi:MAG: HNH endonuclease [Planctomycetaceae bacterium]|nr:HNH endonuclease [Planctomycetaceae bacterium]